MATLFLTPLSLFLGVVLTWWGNEFPFSAMATVNSRNAEPGCHAI